MTKREVYEAVIANQNVSEEIRSYFEDELVKMDERNRRNAEKRAEKAKENEPIKAAIFEALGEEPKTATTIRDEISGEFDVSTQKVSAMLRKLVEAGDVDKEDVKIKGKGTQKGYTRG